ncbi:MAG TPA: AraC family transcriptional regulator [Longimicrobiales bacterium]
MSFILTENHYQPGLVQQRHAHRETSVTLILAGALEEHVGQTHEYARPLSVVIKPADTEHVNRISDAGATTLQLRLPAGLLADELKMLGGWRWEHAGPVAQQFVRVLSAFRLRADHLDNEVIDLLAAVRPLQPRAGQDPPRWLAAVCEEIEDTLPAVLRVQLIARGADVHPVYLARQFRRFFGCSVTDYIARRRAQLAASYLARPDLGLSAVAYQAGYADQSHLCRGFRAASGVTPRAYRRLTQVSSVQYASKARD